MCRRQQRINKLCRSNRLRIAVFEFNCIHKVTDHRALVCLQARIGDEARAVRQEFGKLRPPAKRRLEHAIDERARFLEFRFGEECRRNIYPSRPYAISVGGAGVDLRGPVIHSVRVTVTAKKISIVLPDKEVGFIQGIRL